MSDPDRIDGQHAALSRTLQPGSRDAAFSRPAADEEFASFYRATMRPLVQFLLNQGAGIHLAADIAQESMGKAYRRWTEIEHPRAWVHKVASRSLVRHISQAVEDPTDPVPEPSSHLPRPDLASQWEAEQAMLQILQALPPRQRQVRAWTVSGYTPAEIAAELGLSPEAVRSSLKKVRRAATQHLKQRGEHQ